MLSALTDAPPMVLHQIADSVNAALRRVVDEAGLPVHLRDAVLYAALGGGKRLRPALALLGCEAVGGRRDDAMPAATALELTHSFSLVHDDLPAMDDDQLRRGRPTLHVHAGEAMAILAGDLMVSLAFAAIAGAEGLSASVRLELGRELSAATTAMIAGQVYDTLGGLPAGLDERQRLELIHRSKTGALLRASCRMGAICGDADDGRLERLTRYGEAVGVMFQAVDDLLDVTQSAEHLGKASGKDQSAGKLTFPGLLGVDETLAEIRRLEKRAIEALDGLGPPAEPLRELVRYLAVRTR